MGNTELIRGSSTEYHTDSPAASRAALLAEGAGVCAALQYHYIYGTWRPNRSTDWPYTSPKLLCYTNTYTKPFSNNRNLRHESQKTFR